MKIKFITTFLSSLIAISVININASSQSFSNDTVRGSWLPIKCISEREKDNLSVPVDKFLKNLKGSFRPLICYYSGSHLKSTSCFVNDNLQTEESLWTCKVKTSGKSHESGKVLEIEITYKYIGGVEQSAGIAVAFDFTEWDTNNYILVPAQLYGGNRFHILPIGIDETPERLRRMVLTLDNLVFNAQGKTNLFYAINKDGKLMGDVHGRQEECPAISMTRRSYTSALKCST